MICASCGNYTNATVNGVHGGRVPVCDSCIATEPDAVYRIPNHPHPSVRVRGARASVPGPAASGALLPDAAARNPVPSFTGNAKGEAPAMTPPQRVGSRATLHRVIHSPGKITITAKSPPPGTFTVPVVLELPEPPSANRWWRRHGSVMHLSREAKAYKANVAAILTARRDEIVGFREGCPVSVIIVWRRDRKAGDLDKRLGVLLDALQGVVYANDSQVVQIWARRCDEHPELEPGTVRVEVSAL